MTLSPPSKARILLIGAGGVGTIAALNLEIGGLAHVTAVLRSNYNRVVADGFNIKSIDHGEVCKWTPSRVINQVPNYTDEEFDYIVMATKNIAETHPSAAELAEPAVTPGRTVIVLIQNGLNIEKPFLSKFPNNICLSGVSLIGSHEALPGVIEHDDPDRLIIGAFRNANIAPEAEDAAAQDFVKIYAAGGKTVCTFSPDVSFHRWKKLVYNACLNPICAITGLDTGRIRLADDSVASLVRPAMQEIVAAAKACGVALPEGIEEHTIHLDPLTIYLKPSMLEDVERGNFTEFENIVGEPMREGTARGVPMPTATFLYCTLKAMQWKIKERKGMVDVPAKTTLT